MRFITAAGFAALLAGSACDVPRADPRISVEDARITLPAVKGRPGAGYFTLRTSTHPARLAGVSSPRIERIELHDSRMEGGAMRMGPLTDTSFPADGRLEFAPGGKHAMLFGVDPALKAGDRVPLVFRFEGAPELRIEAEVLGPGGGRAQR